MTEKPAFKRFEARFETGVQLVIDKDEVSITYEEGHKAVKPENVAAVNDELIVEPTLTPGSLLFRFLGILFVLIFIVAAIGDTFWQSALDGGGEDAVFGSLGSVAIIVVIVGIGILAFGIQMTDGMLFDFQITRGIIARYFSKTGILITIENSAGDDIRFLILESERPKISEIRSAVKSLSIYTEAQSPRKEENALSSDLSQLHQLKQLLDSGVITTDEFALKKNQVLGI